MNDKKYFQYFAGTDVREVIHQLDYFVMAGGAGTHVFITGLQHSAIAIPGFHIHHATHLDKNRFGAPKTTAT
jgi:hypothetical protein